MVLAPRHLVCGALSGAVRRACFRHAAGGSPNSRLNARLKAASDSYPTSVATRMIETLLSRNREAASEVRQRVR